jgi:hypothetical protein
VGVHAPRRRRRLSRHAALAAQGLDIARAGAGLDELEILDTRHIVGALPQALRPATAILCPIERFDAYEEAMEWVLGDLQGDPAQRVAAMGLWSNS